MGYVEVMRDQVEALSPVKAIGFLKLNSTTMHFQLGAISRGQFYKVQMRYDIGADTYSLKYIRVDFDFNSPVYGKAYQNPEGWMNDIYVDNLGHVLKSWHQKRTKIKWVDWVDDVEWESDIVDSE